MDVEVFKGFDISSAEFLDTFSDRMPCPKCKKSRKYFCFICHTPVACPDQLPSIELPVKIDIIKHVSEYHGKSTSCHAAILAPKHVQIYKYPTVPEYDKDKTLLVFPSKYAKSLEDWFSDESSETPVKRRKVAPWFDTVVFIDCTWNQTSTLEKDERLKDLKRVVLKNHESKFWRFQRDNPRTFLSTIEAVYYFCVELDELTSSVYDKKYDNLLFYFKYLYNKLYNLCDGGKNLKAYQNRLPNDQPISSD